MSRTLKELLETKLPKNFFEGEFKNISFKDGNPEFRIHLTNLFKIGENADHEVYIITRNTCETYKAFDESLGIFMYEYIKYSRLIGKEATGEEIEAINNTIASLQQNRNNLQYKNTVSNLINIASPRKNKSLAMNFVGNKDFDFSDINADENISIIHNFLKNTGIDIERLPKNRWRSLYLTTFFNNSDTTIVNGERIRMVRDAEIGKITANIKEYLAKYKDTLTTDYRVLSEEERDGLKTFWQKSVLKTELTTPTPKIRIDMELNAIKNQLNTTLKSPWKMTIDEFIQKHSTFEEALEIIEMSENLLLNQKQEHLTPNQCKDIIFNKNIGETGYEIIHYIQSVFTAIMLEHMHCNSKTRKIIGENLITVREELLRGIDYGGKDFTEALLARVLAGTKEKITEDVVEKIKKIASPLSSMLDSSDHATQAELIMLNPRRTTNDGILEGDKFIIHAKSIPQLKLLFSKLQGLKSSNKITVSRLCETKIGLKKFIDSLTDAEEKFAIMKHVIKNISDIEEIERGNITSILPLLLQDTDFTRKLITDIWSFKKLAKIPGVDSNLLTQLLDDNNFLSRLIDEFRALKQLFEIPNINYDVINSFLNVKFLKTIINERKDFETLFDIPGIDKGKLNSILDDTIFMKSIILGWNDLSKLFEIPYIDVTKLNKLLNDVEFIKELITKPWILNELFQLPGIDITKLNNLLDYEDFINELAKHSLEQEELFKIPGIDKNRLYLAFSGNKKKALSQCYEDTNPRPPMNFIQQTDLIGSGISSQVTLFRFSCLKF